MAHFAQVNDNGIVERVIVVSNDDAPTEAAGKAFIASLGLAGEWVQTSYNGNPIEGQDRGKYAGAGDTWTGSEFVSPIRDKVDNPDHWNGLQIMTQPSGDEA